MAWLIKSKGARLELRDGCTAADPMYLVGDEWVPFRNLPPGIGPDGDGDVEVREVESTDGHKAGEIVQSKPKPPARELVRAAEPWTEGKPTGAKATLAATVKGKRKRK